ncbi:MAG: glycosyltransferase [bacterium]|nr:glycosyltransferase [bacterium]
MKRSLENMNTALVHEWLTNVAGSEKVLLALKEIFADAPIYTSVFDSVNAKPFKKFEIYTSYLQKLPWMKKKRELLIPLTPLAFEQFDLSKYDLVISNTTMAAKGVITKPETIHISYCNTPPRYLWTPEVDPRAKSGYFRSLRAKIMHEMRIWDRVAADRVDYFLANSHYIARRIKKFYGRDAVVVYPPVEIESFQIDEKVERGDHYLFVGRLINYKKCDLVIQAFNKLKLPLRIVGFGSDEKELRRLADKNIEFVGALSGEKLVKEYQQAKALIFPAEEDFGIVPIEAMACGTPVIAFNKGGVTESVVDDETGLFFDEQTPESIITAVKKLDDIKFDSDVIRHQAEKFSKEKFKNNFVAEIEKILSIGV